MREQGWAQGGRRSRGADAGRARAEVRLRAPVVNSTLCSSMCGGRGRPASLIDGRRKCARAEPPSKSLLVTHLGFVLLLVTHLGPFLFVQCSFHHDTHRDFIDFMWEFLLALLHLCYMRIRTYRKREYRDLTDPV